MLEVQELDTRLAQLAHQRRTHPTLATLEELTARAADLQRARTQAGVLVTDTRREVAKAEADVEQVRSRAERGALRLNSGEGTPKELQALTSELEALARRQGVLEEAQLEVMERLEGAEVDLAAMTEQVQAIEAQVADVTAESEREIAVLDAQASETGRAREVLAGGIDDALMSLYERVRSRTGGLGAIALKGEMTVGVQVPLSLTEKAAIREAAPDQVIRSDEYDYLLIRVD
nr:hypothetical protein [Pseudactinotalea sp. HY160]